MMAKIRQRFPAVEKVDEFQGTEISTKNTPAGTPVCLGSSECAMACDAYFISFRKQSAKPSQYA